MNKRTCIRALVVFMLVTSVTLVVHHTQPKVGKIQEAGCTSSCKCDPCHCGKNCHCDTKLGQITGNSQMVPAPSTYTVLAVPKNWRQDQKSVSLVDGFSQKSNMVAMRQHSDLEVYSATSADFRERWAKLCPEVDEGKPVVLVMHNGVKAYKRTGGTAAQVNQELGGVLSSLAAEPRGFRPLRPNNDCPQCHPRPKPKPEPKPTPEDDTPKVAPIADTTPTAPAEGRNIVGLAVLLGVIAAGLTVVTEFRARSGI